MLAPELNRLMVDIPDPMALCRRLINRANEMGGMDNASAVVVYVP